MRRIIECGDGKEEREEDMRRIVEWGDEKNGKREEDIKRIKEREDEKTKFFKKTRMETFVQIRGF